MLPDGSRLYVTNAASDSVSVIDAATNSVAATIAVPDRPTCCAASNSGQYVYVSCLAAESVAVIEVAGDSVIRTIPIDGKPGQLAILPNDSFFWLTQPPEDREDRAGRRRAADFTFAGASAAQGLTGLLLLCGYVLVAGPPR